jgi:hypothetical protein
MNERDVFAAEVQKQRVASRFQTVVASEIAPQMVQVKAGLDGMQRKVRECKQVIADFIDAAVTPTDKLSGWFDEEPSEKDIDADIRRPLYKEVSPILAMVADICDEGVDTCSYDNIDDMRTSGKDIFALCRKYSRPGMSPDTGAMLKRVAQLSDMLVTAADEADKEIPPANWWLRNVDQISIYAKMFTRQLEDEDLTVSLAELEKVANKVTDLDASLITGLENVSKALDKCLKALKDVALPEPPKENENPYSATKKPRKSPTKGGPAKPKKPTFAQVRQVIFDHLVKERWKLAPNLKVPHATSPEGDVRLWFKAQAVYGNANGSTDMKDAHSWVSDLREFVDPKRFEAMVNNHRRG